MCILFLYTEMSLPHAFNTSKPLCLECKTVASPGRAFPMERPERMNCLALARRSYRSWPRVGEAEVVQLVTIYPFYISLLMSFNHYVLHSLKLMRCSNPILLRISPLFDFSIRQCSAAPYLSFRGNAFVILTSSEMPHYHKHHYLLSTACIIHVTIFNTVAGSTPSNFLACYHSGFEELLTMRTVSKSP